MRCVGGAFILRLSTRVWRAVVAAWCALVLVYYFDRALCMRYDASASARLACTVEWCSQKVFQRKGEECAGVMTTPMVDDSAVVPMSTSEMKSDALTWPGGGFWGDVGLTFLTPSIVMMASNAQAVSVSVSGPRLQARGHSSKRTTRR